MTAVDHDADRHPVSGPPQESVWDYPRPPRLEPTSRHIQIMVGGETIAETRRALRVLETSHPPVYYLPPEDVRVELLSRTPRLTDCEWKGTAGYYTVTVGDRAIEDAAWCYPDPAPAFASIAHFLAFYPSKMDRCLVDGVPVVAQPGDYYGGWITPEIAGPFKGDPGTAGW
ncbi:MAG: DUF427 domain-containing protein [Chloroflexota bacterium]|nr:DUF427 domain-containing protein [Chloroflexota bacterium]